MVVFPAWFAPPITSRAGPSGLPRRPDDGGQAGKHADSLSRDLRRYAFENADVLLANTGERAMREPGELLIRGLHFRVCKIGRRAHADKDWRLPPPAPPVRVLVSCLEREQET